MKMTIHPMAGDLTVISLEGRLDIQGADAIDDQFAFATTTKPKRIVVDLSQVVFMASIGIRTLFTAARAQTARGGRIVLAAPTEMVNKVLLTAGVDQLMPIFDSVELACTALESA
ncbi:MAG: STAS domain-containing protein [Proteobacteria bacterium]|nr:STAS domain-containing protein [Burkholderiales bacterium]